MRVHHVHSTRRQSRLRGRQQPRRRRRDGAFLATLNPDAEPAPDWLERLLAAADAHPRSRG